MSCPDSVANEPPVWTWWQRFVKRSFDFFGALFGLIVLGPLILLGWLLATWSCRQNGFFTQQRIGRYARPFAVIKLRTMRPLANITTTVTTDQDPRITRVGRFLRKTKMDELPQLINVLLGQMSFVGPRPDVPGFADKLEGEDRIVLQIRPGITGPASLAFRNEEELLAQQADPIDYNQHVIWPEKVRLNKEYIRSYSFGKDLGYILQTLLPSERNVDVTGE